MNEEGQKRSMPYPLSCPYPMQVHSHKGEIYPLIANKIPLLVYEAKKRHFEKDDFDSFYGIYNKIKSIFETCDELSK